jgi:hypothetical protein
VWNRGLVDYLRTALSPRMHVAGAADTQLNTVLVVEQ